MLRLMVQKSGENPPGMYKNPVNNWINYLSIGAGFQPSTVLLDAIGGWYVWHGGVMTVARKIIAKGAKKPLLDTRIAIHPRSLTARP